MKTEKITNEELNALKISALPTRPCASPSLGGRGLSAEELKRAFDALPLFLAEKINSLLEDIEAEGEESVSAKIKSGIKEGHTLRELALDVKSGALANYLDVFGEPLSELILKMKAEIKELRDMIAGGANV